MIDETKLHELIYLWRTTASRPVESDPVGIALEKAWNQAITHCADQLSALLPTGAPK